MVQDPRKLDPTRSLLDDAVVQMVRLLGLVTLADLVLRRGSNAVVGLRVFEENTWLRMLNDVAPGEQSLLNIVLVAATLSCILLALALARTPSVAARATALLGVVAAIWSISWRLRGPDDSLPPAIALPVFLVAALCVWRRSPAPMAPLLGAALATTWIVLADLDTDDIESVEKIAEVLLTAGTFVAWPLVAVRLGRPGNLAIACALGVGVTILGLAWLNPPAWRHVVITLFGLHTAGLPTPLLASLLALAATSLVGLTASGSASRGIALGLFLLLASARGDESELVPLRVAAVLIIAWAVHAHSRSMSSSGPASSSSLVAK